MSSLKEGEMPSCRHKLAHPKGGINL